MVPLRLNSSRRSRSLMSGGTPPTRTHAWRVTWCGAWCGAMCTGELHNGHCMARYTVRAGDVGWGWGWGWGRE
eukprot:scaffold34196_cov36-Phaeocystis_antarctica.AAC.1